MSDSELYDDAFFAETFQDFRNGARIVVPAILELFPDVRSVIDVGCGQGIWLRTFQEHGITAVTGIDGNYITKLWIPPARFHPIDLSRTWSWDKGRADLAICLETAEHLPAEAGPCLVANLCKMSDLVVFSAAVPGQPGRNHINARWPDYWWSVFSGHGYRLDDSLAPFLKGHPENLLRFYYRDNIRIYRK